MKIPVGVKIAALTLLSTGFYMYVGQLVPQKEVYPPAEVAISKDISVEELVETGKKIAESKGMCTTCHTIGQSGALRFPDLDGVATRAATRVPGLSALQYLAQSIYEPDAFIVPGFNPGMPVINKPPIGLTDPEILAVVAYLQTLGGTVTVTPDMDLRNPAETAVEQKELPDNAEVVGEEGPSAEEGGDLALLNRFECGSCHYLDRPGRFQGPSLFDVGSRMDFRSILAATLSPQGGHDQAAFYQTVRPEELRRMALYLETRKGEP